MPIVNGEIICPKCGERNDKQIIKDFFANQDKLKEETFEVNIKLKETLDNLCKISKEQERIKLLYETLNSLELLLSQTGDTKLMKLLKSISIIESNLPNSLFLYEKTTNSPYKKSYSIKENKSIKGTLEIYYNGDLLTADVILNSIGENSFTINDDRVIEVLHFIESIYYKKNIMKH